jgi:hypothetical protein
MSSDTLDAFVGIEGFFDMIPRDWVTELDNGTVKLPGYCEKNGLIAKEKRASDNKARQAAWRARNEKSNGVTNASHNASVTRYDAVTKCVDSDSDSDSDSDKNKNSEKNPSAAAPPTRVARPKVPRESSDPDWLLDFKLAYPDRAGDQGWRRAMRAANERLREGHVPTEFIEGARRYAAFCQATGKANTEFVKQAASFLGPDKAFLLPWNLPNSRADTRLAGNLSAAEEFMRRTEPTQ